MQGSVLYCQTLLAPLWLVMALPVNKEAQPSSFKKSKHFFSFLSAALGLVWLARPFYMPEGGPPDPSVNEEFCGPGVAWRGFLFPHSC